MGVPELRYVWARVGYEATEVGYCRDIGTDGECLLGIWDASDSGTFIQVLRTHYVVHRQQLASGGSESVTGAGEVGSNGKDLVDIRVG